MYQNYPLALISRKSLDAGFTGRLYVKVCYRGFSRSAPFVGVKRSMTSALIMRDNHYCLVSLFRYQVT